MWLRIMPPFCEETAGKHGNSYRAMSQMRLKMFPFIATRVYNGISPSVCLQRLTAGLRMFALPRHVYPVGFVDQRTHRRMAQIQASDYLLVSSAPLVDLNASSRARLDIRKLGRDMCQISKEKFQVVSSRFGNSSLLHRLSKILL